MKTVSPRWGATIGGRRPNPDAARRPVSGREAMMKNGNGRTATTWLAVAVTVAAIVFATAAARHVAGPPLAREQANAAP